MTVPLYFSRARLKQDASIRALTPLLLGKTGRGGASQQPGHHLVWSLFADSASRQRDFLWREMAPGTFLILSARPPQNLHGLFELAEPKPFAPALAAGDALGFSLRANPVVRRRSSPNSRGIKHDVVMDAIRSRPSGERASHRLAAVQEQGLNWLGRQGDRYGFALEPNQVQVCGYQQHRIARGRSDKPMSFSTLDFEGALNVRDPEAFLPAIANGFGSAKAYGCGLMLIRRA
ncbi:MAG: type I-E CRISPR-associated protein Cas6/Cse3/CasE [Gammaproteobacteria bacterium]|nr:type I-E CRISPR-associated protein Cas6/Cse3/CasE [Gammaproteobacteria bacterium]MDE0271052.1 type I-E CRISPR-associated protein Cas6/Cse3/CasE [Gammaproteobacteria bacterium]